MTKRKDLKPRGSTASVYKPAERFTAAESWARRPITNGTSGERYVPPEPYRGQQPRSFLTASTT